MDGQQTLTLSRVLSETHLKEKNNHRTLFLHRISGDFGSNWITRQKHSNVSAKVFVHTIKGLLKFNVF